MTNERGTTTPAGKGAVADQGCSPAAGLVELRLTEKQITLLRREGGARPMVAGEVLFREGTSAATSS
jgi:hypothetical protein